MKVKYLNFIEQWREEKRQLLPVLLNVLDSGQYVGVRGKEITRFEKRVSKECKMKYAVALNSGTDSLTFALHSVGVKRGDEVITSGGIIGTVDRVFEDDRIELNISEGVKVQVIKNTIQGHLKKETKK